MEIIISNQHWSACFVINSENIVIIHTIGLRMMSWVQYSTYVVVEKIDRKVAMVTNEGG